MTSVQHKKESFRLHSYRPDMCGQMWYSALTCVDLELNPVQQEHAHCQRHNWKGKCSRVPDISECYADDVIREIDSLNFRGGQRRSLHIILKVIKLATKYVWHQVVKSFLFDKNNVSCRLWKIPSVIILVQHSESKQPSVAEETSGPGKQNKQQPLCFRRNFAFRKI